MIDEPILVPAIWRRAISLVRVLFALAGLVIEVRLAEPVSPVATVLLAGFLAYGIAELAWKGGRKPSYALLTLIADTLFFLICATIDAPVAAWLCAGVYLYLMASAVLFHHWKHVLTVTVVCAGLFPLIRPDDAGRLVPALAGAGVLVLLASRQRQILLDRLVASSRQAVVFRKCRVSSACRCGSKLSGACSSGIPTRRKPSFSSSRTSPGHR
jgi:hypothetical protein